MDEASVPRLSVYSTPPSPCPTGAPDVGRSDAFGRHPPPRRAVVRSSFVCAGRGLVNGHLPSHPSPPTPRSIALVVRAAVAGGASAVDEGGRGRCQSPRARATATASAVAPLAAAAAASAAPPNHPPPPPQPPLSPFCCSGGWRAVATGGASAMDSGSRRPVHRGGRAAPDREGVADGGAPPA